jgi:polysaccharide biosynthesis transport protein
VCLAVTQLREVYTVYTLQGETWAGLTGFMPCGKIPAWHNPCTTTVLRCSIQRGKTNEMTGQITLRDIPAIFRRRRLLLLSPPVVITMLCILAAYLMPRKYESSTTIWVQRDEVLNPLVSFTMAVQMASEDRMRAFNEIVMSRQTMEMLIDTLRLADGSETPMVRDDLVDRTRSKVHTERRGSDSFVITFTDTDPVTAQQAVKVLADHFIATRLQAERTRNDYTVDFFSQKLNEYQERFDETEKNMVSLLRQRVQETPSNATSLTSRLDVMDTRLRGLEDKFRDMRRAQVNVDMFPSAFRTERGRQALAELQRIDLIYGKELQVLLSQYDSVTTRYTDRHPDVERLESRILEFLKRSRILIESEVAALTTQIADEKRRRSETVEEMMNTSVAQREDQDKESNYGLYKQLYNDMKVKLEQARIAQQLGQNAQNQFIIIDPARIPAKPSKPNRPLIILGGMAVGLLLGIFSAFLGEMVDTTVRSREQLEIYGRPVIGILPSGVPINVPRLLNR